MIRSSLLFFISVSFLFTACTPPATPEKSVALDQLFSLMSGTFSSEAQAAEDSSYYNINLEMRPIWESDPEARWLYVEQAVATYLDKPYRQRVYKLSQNEAGIFESRVYELANPQDFIHAWEKPELFEALSPDSLILREGCAVYLGKGEDNCYTGATREKECLSSLRGATYATSKVTVCGDEIRSWDQGWNSEDEQVWGAEKAGYVFKRKL